MTFDPAALDLLNAGAPSAKFPTIGTTIAGTVLGAEIMQQRDFDTDEPAWWDAAKTQPKNQLVITLRTAERDVANPTDNGDRRLFVKGKMLAAVKKATASNRLAQGGELAVTYSADLPKTNPKFNAPKDYTATYTPPPAGWTPPVDVGELDEPAF